MKHLLITIAALVLVGCGEASNPEADSALMDAAMFGYIQAANKAIASGADVNLKDENGFTPLHFSAWYGHKKVMELLITKGVKSLIFFSSSNFLTFISVSGAPLKASLL